MEQGVMKEAGRAINKEPAGGLAGWGMQWEVVEVVCDNWRRSLLGKEAICVFGQVEVSRRVVSGCV